MNLQIFINFQKRYINRLTGNYVFEFWFMYNIYLCFNQKYSYIFNRIGLRTLIFYCIMSVIHVLVRVVKVGLVGITDGRYAVSSYRMRI